MYTRGNVCVETSLAFHFIYESSLNLRVAVSGSLAAYWVLCFCLLQSALRGEPPHPAGLCMGSGDAKSPHACLTNSLHMCSHLHGIGVWLLKRRFILPCCKERLSSAYIFRLVNVFCHLLVAGEKSGQLLLCLKNNFCWVYYAFSLSCVYLLIWFILLNMVDMVHISTDFL